MILGVSEGAAEYFVSPRWRSANRQLAERYFEGSRRREPVVVHRHRRHQHHDQQRTHADQSEAAERARRQRRRRDPPAAATSCEGGWHHVVHAAGAGSDGGRSRQPHANFSTAWKMWIGKELAYWTPKLYGQGCKALPRIARCCQRPAQSRLARDADHRSRHRFAPGHSSRRRSTTRCTTPSASGKSPRCSRSSTSTTWCWK